MPGPYGAAMQYAVLQFGGPVEEADTTVLVTTSATKLVGNNPDRVMLMFVNLAGAPVFVLPGNNPSATNGISISQNGGSMVTIVRDDGTLPTREWYGVSTSGSASVYVLELRRFAETSQIKAGGG